MTAIKSVLISYLDSSKPVKIPAVYDGTELDYLTRIFMKAFSFESNVNLKITFQRFSTDWEQYVDLDENDIVIYIYSVTRSFSFTLKFP